MTDHLAVSVAASPSRVLVRVSGECDATTAEQLRDTLTSQRTSAAPLIVADLSGLTFIDVAVAHALIEAHDHLASNGKRLILVCPQQLVARVLDLTGASLLIPVFRGSNDEPGCSW